jgi:hypothetical protein
MILGIQNQLRFFCEHFWDNKSLSMMWVPKKATQKTVSSNQFDKITAARVQMADVGGGRRWFLALTNKLWHHHNNAIIKKGDIRKKYFGSHRK